MGAGYDMWQLFASPDDAGGGLDPATRQRMAMQAAALRRQGQLGTVAAFTGDKVLAPYGQHLLTAAQQGGEQLAAVPEKRTLQRLRELQGRKEALDVTGAEAEQARNTNAASASSGLARQLLGKFMPGAKVAPNATAADLMPALGLAEKAYQVDENARNRAALARLRAGPGASGLTPEALDMLAEQFATTGKLPALGVGAAGAALKAAVVGRAAELHPGTDLAGAAASYGADTGSLKKLQQQADAVDSFERTATANLDTALGAAKKVVDTGSPWFNKPLRAVQQGLAGSADMQRFITARQVAVNEVAKVLSGGSGAGVVSDSARQEVEQLLGPDASLAQIEAAAQVLKQDMANRKAAMAAQLGEIRGRASHGKAAPEVQPSAVAPAQGAGWTPEKQKRLEELRKKKAEGKLQ